jgi:hypothetical protein
MWQAAASSMVSSDAVTVEAYLEELPEARREIIKKVREMILENLPTGYEEVMNWGMITYQVPLEFFTDTYNGKPLMFAGLASQKRHCSLYMMPVYQNPESLKKIEAAYIEIGRKPSMGKSCLRFTSLTNLPLALLGEMIGQCEMADFIEASRRC